MSWRLVALLAGLGFGSYSAYQFSPQIHAFLKERAARQSAVIARGVPSQHLPEPASAVPAAPDQEVAGGETDGPASGVPMPLVLVGTVRGGHPRDGAALIGVNAGNPQTYSAGALLSNGAQLTEIHERFVILERDGQTARLYLQNSKENAVRDSRNSLLVAGASAPRPAPVATTDEVITNYIRFGPQFDGDRLLGYKVYPGKKSSVFHRMQLKSGDLITSLGGMVLNDPEQAVAMFHELASGAALQATVERAGRRAQIPLDGSLIVADQTSVQAASGGPMSAASSGT